LGLYHRHYLTLLSWQIGKVAKAKSLGFYERHEDTCFCRNCEKEANKTVSVVVWCRARIMQVLNGRRNALVWPPGECERIFHFHL